MRPIRIWLWRVARWPRLGGLWGWVFRYMSWAIPVHRLRETRTLLAFYHPQPAYVVHILLVPKRGIGSVTAVQPTDADFLVDLFQVVQSLVAELSLTEPGYRLIVNGGAYQDVPQLHVHLVSGSVLDKS